MTKRRIWRKMVNMGFTKKKVKWALILAALKWTVTIILVAVLAYYEKWRDVYGLILALVAIAAFFLVTRKKART